MTWRLIRPLQNLLGSHHEPANSEGQAAGETFPVRKRQATSFTRSSLTRGFDGGETLSLNPTLLQTAIRVRWCQRTIPRPNLRLSIGSVGNHHIYMRESEYGQGSSTCLRRPEAALNQGTPDCLTTLYEDSYIDDLEASLSFVADEKRNPGCSDWATLRFSMSSMAFDGKVVCSLTARSLCSSRLTFSDHRLPLQARRLVWV